MKAIVILYNGNNPTEDVVTGMLRVLATAQPTGETPGTATVLDDTTVAKVLVEAKTGATVHSVLIPNEETPQDRAVIFLGEEYSAYINMSTEALKDKLSHDFIIAKFVETRGYASEKQKNLIKAMTLLAEHSYKISAALVKKYNFNKSVLKAILEIYNKYNQ